MEGLAWLLLKMSALLALTGAAFFVLGWWLRGKQSSPPPDEAPMREAVQWKAAANAAEAECAAARSRLDEAEARAASAESEVVRLRELAAQSVAAVDIAPAHEPAPAADLVLQPPPEAPSKPKAKAKAKPRAKKKPKA